MDRPTRRTGAEAVSAIRDNDTAIRGRRPDRVRRPDVLDQIELNPQSLDRYASSAGPEAIASYAIWRLRCAASGVLHLNATSYGGGVAEMLRSEIPLLRDLGHPGRLAGADRRRIVLRSHQEDPQRPARLNAELTRIEQETYLSARPPTRRHSNNGTTSLRPRSAAAGRSAR